MIQGQPIKATTQEERKRTAIANHDLKSVFYQAKPVLNESYHAIYVQLLRDFSVVFSEDEWGMGKCALVRKRIQVEQNPIPVELLNHQMARHLKADHQEKVDKLLEPGLTELCQSLYSTTAIAMLVAKKKGKLRLVIDDSS